MADPKQVINILAFIRGNLTYDDLFLQQALIDAKRAEVLAKLAKFQKSTAAAAAPSRPAQPPIQQPVSTKPASPIPAPPAKGSSGGLNLVEIQRRIAEAKSKISINPAAAAAVSIMVCCVRYVHSLKFFHVVAHQCQGKKQRYKAPRTSCGRVR